MTIEDKHETVLQIGIYWSNNMKNRTIILIFVVLASFVIVMANLYSFRKALFFLILIIIGIAFTSLPLLYIGKMLKFDIEIMKNGEKQTGRCIRYEHGSRSGFGALVVELEDNKGRTRQIKYNAMRFHFKYPYDITVYKLNNSVIYSNLGVLTIAREILYFLFFLSIWFICTVGTIHWIVEIIKYG